MSTTVTIETVSSPAAWAAFVEFPWAIYGDDPQWAPTPRSSQKQLLNRQKHPFWQTSESAFFLARRGSRIVGRIAAIVHQASMQMDSRHPGFFGFFEAFDDLDVFQRLFQAAEHWLLSRGCGYVCGPFNPSINYETGILIEGFDSRPFFMLTYNPPYYAVRIEASSYRPDMDFYAYHVGPGELVISERMRLVMAGLQRRRSIVVRPLRLARFADELALLHRIYNDAFAHHRGFVPMTDAEFMQLGKDLRPILDPEFIQLLEIDGTVVGFVLAVPDYNQVFARLRDGRLFPFGFLKFLYYKRHIDAVRVMTVAIVRSYQHWGLGPFLYERIFQVAKRRNMGQGELSWVAADNGPMNKAALAMGARAYKTYRTYGKPLTAP